MPTASANRYFSVLYKGTKIGTHSIAYSSATGETTVSTDIRLLVKVAFLTVLTFTHRSTEIWRGGRLWSLAGETLEHGEPFGSMGLRPPRVSAWSARTDFSSPPPRR